MADTEGSFERRRVNRPVSVERRQRTPVLWILAVAVFLLLLAILFPARPGPDVDQAMPGAAGEVATDSEMRAADAEGAIAEFTRFVGSQQAGDAVGPKHEYTAEGLRRLATAVSAVALGDSVAVGALEPRIQALRTRADALQRDPSARTHALKTREAFLLAASVLESIQDGRFPNLDREATALTRAAEAVKVREPLTEQAEAVQRFFDRATELLQGMGSPTG